MRIARRNGLLPTALCCVVSLNAQVRVPPHNFLDGHGTHAPVSASLHAANRMPLLAPIIKVNVKDGAEMLYRPAGYYIYRSLVTVAQYRKFCAEAGHSMPPEPSGGWQAARPILNVTQEDKAAYARWAGMQLATAAQQAHMVAYGAGDGHEHIGSGTDFPLGFLCTMPALPQVERKALAKISDSRGRLLPGLYVSHGILMHAGKAYYGIGANYYSALATVLENPLDTTLEGNLAALSAVGIPFIRFNAGAYWPNTWKLYRDHRADFLARFDRVVRAAEKEHIGLIPSFFWNAQSVPDLVGEPLLALTDPGSKSVAFVRQYTAEIVKRYRNSPAIWAWEFGNETNLSVDLPGARTNAVAQKAVPTLGTPTRYTENDMLTSAVFPIACNAFAETVRKFDITRPLITGNAIPRLAAFHNSLAGNWEKDSLDQTAAILARDNPGEFNTACIHLYPEDEWLGKDHSVSRVLALMSGLAKEQGRPLILGEFGASGKSASPREQAAVFQTFLDGIVANRVPLSAFWVFGYDNQDDSWNITPRNGRAFMLRMAAEANARLQKAGRQ